MYLIKDKFSNHDDISWYFGNYNSLNFEIFLIILTMILDLMLTEKGYNENMYTYQQNIYTTFMKLRFLDIYK